MHENSQKKAENVFIEPIYTGARLRLGIYSPHIYIKQFKCSHIMRSPIYIYTGLNPSCTKPNHHAQLIGAARTHTKQQ